MVTFVCICNLLIALVNCWIAWQLWQLRQTLIKTTKSFREIEVAASLLLAPVAEVIIEGQKSTHDLKQRYLKLKQLIQQLQLVFTLLNWTYSIWRQFKPSRLNQSRENFSKEQLLWF